VLKHVTDSPPTCVTVADHEENVRYQSDPPNESWAARKHGIASATRRMDRLRMA